MLAVAQHDHDAPGADERTSALYDQLEDVPERDLPADRDRDISSGVEAAERLLELLATALAGLIGLRVVDRDRCPIGEDRRGLLIPL